jgi:tetratricopeptide (TPR) repeat protein
VLEAKNTESWNIVSDPRRSAEQYAEALRLAAEITQIQPESGYYMNTLGVAQYRVGRFQEAVESLTRSESLNAKQIGSPHPVDLAFLAMAYHRAGKIDQANEVLARARELMKDKRWTANPESKASLSEAALLIERSPTP